MSASILNSLPSKTVYSYSRAKYEDVAHSGVWSLQLSLVQLNPSLLTENSNFVDGFFGPRTEEAVKRYQKNRQLGADGVAGPATQKRIVWGWKNSAEKDVVLPENLLDGFCENEGGWMLAAVNWGVAGGVDVGAVQNRVYDLRGAGAPWPLKLTEDGKYTGIPTDALLEAVKFNPEAVARALDAKGRIKDLAIDLKSRHAVFYARRAESLEGHPSYHNHEYSWKYAALYHNWPYAADRLSRGYKLSDKNASWIPQKLRDQGITTYADWADFYINLVTKYVADSGWNIG